ncbi:MAG: aspT [Geobacteraceae bacterium]|nr:aspT [Geobacteraceae bacterium]
MTQEIVRIAQASPELLVFLALAMGYFIGKIKIKGFGLGTTASVLIAAMVLGQISVDVPPLLKSISFALFAFCIGYQVGPQFFGSLRKEGFNYLWITLVVAIVGLVSAMVMGEIFHFDPGTTAGLFAGAMTQSAAIGTAQGAVAHLSISDAAKATIDGNIAVAFAITYIFGTVGVIIFFKMLPGILRIDLKKEARRLEEKMGLSSLSKTPGLFLWSRLVGLRAYCVSQPGALGRKVGEIEKAFSVRVTIEKVKRGAELKIAEPDMVVQEGDILVMTGNYEGLVFAADIIGHEVDVSGIMEIIGESLAVCVLNRDFIGKSLGDLANEPGARGLYLRRITRQGREIPIARDTSIQKCDVLQLVGAKDTVEKAAQVMGYPQRPTSATDLMMVGVGCVLGTLLGMVVIPIMGVPTTLSTAGGVIVAGLVAGWLRSVHPTFGQIPDAGQWLLNDLGLNLFIACIGLASGKQAIAVLQASGFNVFLAGVVVALAPIMVGVLFGKFLLRMNPVLLLGALTGARVTSAALTTLQDDAESSTLTLGFAAPYAFANFILTIMGSIIINMM